MNTELLLKVKQHILEEPSRLIMGDWLMAYPPGLNIRDFAARITVPSCGTVGCIAGWVCELGGVEQARSYTSLRAAQLLDISSEDARRLFHRERWTNYALADAFAEESDLQKRAQIV